MTASVSVAQTIAPRRRPPGSGAVLLLVATFFAGCAAAPPVALPQGWQQPTLKFFVAHATGDGSHMEQGIATELRNRGLSASSGPFEQMPPDTDVLVIYSDSWWANILAQGEILRLEARTARTGHTIATAEQRWVSYVFDTPTTLIPDAVARMLGAPTSEAR